jgi:hypothetical protein
VLLEGRSPRWPTTQLQRKRAAKNRVVWVNVVNGRKSVGGALHEGKPPNGCLPSKLVHVGLSVLKTGVHFVDREFESRPLRQSKPCARRFSTAAAFEPDYSKPAILVSFSLGLG